ncbi:hypothetical protein CRG98_019053 [Punica granatum]|uniref:Uncharacterized protein n=1 Tax=Punica granatum TaxID=22663 RepID=A0A2I0JW92_PUNGR|nr:hypothetical protein CRG98_019053 [Punica granatum]
MWISGRPEIELHRRLLSPPLQVEAFLHQRRGHHLSLCHSNHCDGTAVPVVATTNQVSLSWCRAEKSRKRGGLLDGGRVAPAVLGVEERASGELIGALLSREDNIASTSGSHSGPRPLIRL